MRHTPMIATYVTTPLPAMVEAAGGSRALRAIFARAEVPALAPRSVGRFIPQRNMLGLLEASARVLGARDLGLLYGPELDVADWGVWGAYVRGATTLEDALRRSGRAMRYHVSMDTLSCEVRGDEALFVHRAALAGGVGYRHYAAGAASAMLSLVRAFAGPDWTPDRMEFDLPRPASTTAWEDLFRCPVVFDRPEIVIAMPRSLLAAPPRAAAPGAPVTLADLRRLVSGGPPRDLAGEIAEIVRLRLLDGRSDLEGLARQMAIGPRTLQRRLGEAGTSYRDVVARARAERAADLLGEPDLRISQISAALGYASPTHFSRAFRRDVGRAPTEVRRDGGRAPPRGAGLRGA